MLNIVVPMSGEMPFFKDIDYPYPKPLVEINGRPMIEYLVRNLLSCGPEVRIVFLVREDHVKKFYLGNTIRLLARDQSVVQSVPVHTGGALCTVLMAVELIDNNQRLLIVNFDQYFTHNFREGVEALFQTPYEGGCFVFESVHPRWSFVRTLGEDIVEASEKRPISRQAIAGVYGFSRGADFVAAANQALLKDASHDGSFYVSSVINEMVLINKRLRAINVPAGAYHSFYSPAKIAEFTSSLA